MTPQPAPAPAPQGGGWNGGWNGGGRVTPQPAPAPQGGGWSSGVGGPGGREAPRPGEHGRAAPGGWDRGSPDRGGWDRRDADRGGWDRRDGDRGGWDRRDGGWDRRDGGPDRRSYAYGAGRSWDRGWREDHRYDWRGWRDQNRSTFHIGRYFAPYNGYYYRRLSVGFFLERLFFAQNYWIYDPWNYRLPPVYGPYRWVRYYDDALLVDVQTGMVVDIVYDLFW
ncbi:hypothetical protein GTZ99_04195 [Novosphingobium sp. FSY-8]|uniref:Nickel/cobalt transporter regulator n=1 Tax=Novosphingobium ovatum TaxID=1908523 RepID=A0ABW9XB44_9SPHN|nr:hypothetical protein [Novosphingobium ovatum]